jgi:hypothetical protein
VFLIHASVAARGDYRGRFALLSIAGNIPRKIGPRTLVDAAQGWLATPTPLR